MEQAPSRGGRKRRGGGKRKRSASRNAEDEERKTEDPTPKQDEDQEEEKPQPKQQQDKPKPKTWNCPACTFLNEASRCFCEMCETPNPTPPVASGRTLGVAASSWSCAACTMVNPSAMRVCAMCGSLNPQPAGLSMARLSDALRGGADASLSSSSSEDSEEQESDDEEDSWICKTCDTIATGRACPNCFVQRPKARKADEKNKEERKRALLKKRKRRKREKKMREKAKMAYGVSIYELKKLVLEPTSSRLVDTLQTLTHTLAMMDASADNEWADGSSFLVRGFGGGMPSSSETAKDPELLTVLADIFRGHERAYPVEVRLLAVQSINYLMKMDRHMFARAKMVEIVGLYIADLLAWKGKLGTSTTTNSGEVKSAQMIVEECLSGLTSMCSTEAFALRELLAHGNFAKYLEFLLSVVDGHEEKDGGFHPSILMTALGILQKCCIKLRWDGKPSQKRRLSGQGNTQKPIVSRVSPKKATCDGQLTLELATKLVAFLRHVLQHKHVPLHVKAAKCLLLVFNRTPDDRPEFLKKLVTPDALRKFVAVVVNANSDESEDSRLAMVSLLLHLFDNRPQLVNMFVQEKIYADLFGGMLPLLQSSSTALRTNALKLTAMLTRVVCRRHSVGSDSSSRRSSVDESTSERQGATTSGGSACRSPRSRSSRQRLNSLPDPDVLSTLLLDFIRADSLSAVNVLLKDGADLNFPKTFDVHGNEIEKPLNVAVEVASLGMVRLLLKRGADIHQVGIGGTALHVAAKTGRCDVAAFLLQCGARVQARDRDRKTVMDVVNAADNPTTGDNSVMPVISPMKKLLEHQRFDSSRDYDSDLSESDEMSAGTGRSRAWFYPSDHDDEYGEDDDIEDDELDGEEGYYMDYDDDDDDDDGGFVVADQRDEEMGEGSVPSDEDIAYYGGDMSSEMTPSIKRRLNSVASESEMKSDGAELSSRDRSTSGGSDKDCLMEDAVVGPEPFSATADQIYGFSMAIAQCLLAVLHDMDIQNVERSVISTVACVLEMAPSQLIRSLKEADVVLILDTVHFLLQGEKHRQATPDTATSMRSAETSTSMASGTTAGSSATAHNSNLPSYILAVRILEAMIRKSSKDSSILHQIERRGISEQMTQLNDASACWVSTSLGGTPRNPSDTIFGRGLELLKSLRADMMESGMLHLHKLRNLSRRLTEFTDASSPSEKELILVDLVELFEQANSITTYEFKQSELLPAVLQYLSPQGELDEVRAIALMKAFERSPSALKHLVLRLQSIITQEENFPLVSFNSGKGRELYPLTRQLKIAFTRPGDRSAGDKLHGRPKSKSIHSSPLTHFQSFERTIARCLPVLDSDLSLLYCNLVGHSIQKVVEGKWRKFLVVGYDDKRSHHLVKPIGGSDDDLAEMVIHDSQCKLVQSVDVYDGIECDLALFGLPDAASSGGSADGKKKRNKRKRKSSAHKQQLDDSQSACQVEVKNIGGVEMEKLPGAWYAAVLVNDSGDISRLNDGAHHTCEEVLSAHDTHSVKLLADSRIVRKVSSDCLRPRTLQPQVGSVVEVDGALGEVTRVYGSGRSTNSASSAANKLLDVRISTDIEKSRVKKDRVRFPPQGALIPRLGIEAMSIGRLFPARDSSLLAGSVGDRVWVLPPSGSSIKDLSVAGTIKSFPSGLESIQESSTVRVEISFGMQPALVVKVKQDRVLNFAAGAGLSSGRGPSRLLAALQMASGRSGTSRLFGGGRSGQDGGSSAIHRAFERVAGSLQHSRLGGGLGSSESAMDQLRNLISRNAGIGGANAPNDIDSADQTPATTQGPEVTTQPSELIGSEVQTEEASTSSPCSASVSRQQKFPLPEKKNGEISSALQAFRKPDGAKPKMTCLQLPKVNLVVGFRKCDASVAAQDRIVVSSEFGLERVDRGSGDKDVVAASSLIQLNPSTQRFEATTGARKALLDVFNSFAGSTSPGASQKKKRRKLSPVAQLKTVPSGAPWDIEKFITFMLAQRGPVDYTLTDRQALQAKYCVVFSKFADPGTSRKLLRADGFLSLMVHECKDEVKSKQLIKFLRSRGYSEKSLSASASRSSSGDDEEEKFSPSSGGSGGAKATKVSGRSTMRQPVVLRGFPADQNVLKCVEDLRQENRTRTGKSDVTSSTADTALPPWKLTYKLYCDFQVEWEALSSSNTRSTSSSAELLQPLAELESRPPTRLLTHGMVTLDGVDANGATEASRWLSRVTASQASGESRDGLVVPDAVASAVRLLRYLFQFRAGGTDLDEGLWTSPRLYNKLETQLQDVLSMCSGIYPPWCDALVTHCKFFFPRELREKLFRSTSFGCTRSLHWFRNQLNIEEGSADSMSSMVGGGIYNQEISISPIPKERVKVHRENILQSAEAVMKMHGKRKAILDVVFVGEKGYGSGVTAAFYSTAAHALQAVKENQKSRCWIPGEDDEAEATKEVDATDDIADDAAVIRHSNGLFPYPHRTKSPKLVERFRMMGRLAGKALMDERLLPLPLSTQFMKLVVGESFGIEELGDIFLSHGRILYSMYKASTKLAAGERDVQIDQMGVQDWLDAVGFTFIDPFSQDPLVSGGQGIAVTASNLTSYVRAVLELWLDSGIRAQVLAFREGISEVLPLGKLRLLFVPELLSLLCGEEDIEWTAESLLKDTKLAHGYTKDSQPVQFFFEVLEELSGAERRAFLLYATGCPNLPPGGFQALKPPFEVVRRVVDNLAVDRALPFARTCTNTLHLPAYSSKAVLAKQVAFAIANSRGVIDRD
jgi:hypothetical protein